MTVRMAVLILILVLGIGCSSSQPLVTGASQNVDLPDPDPDHPLVRVMQKRESIRAFSDRPLTPGQLSLLVWSAQGLTGDAVTGATRTAPSAGATHPLELVVAVGRVEGVEPGVYRYDPDRHRLTLVAEGDVRPELAAACLGQQFIASAPAVIIITAHYGRTTDRYGERGKQYVMIEAGHAAQNIGLSAAALDLGTVVVGAFNEGQLSNILDTDGSPLLVLPVGHPQ